ncbi:GEVED domain-containing protein [Psychroserpens ponticola]|uniref:GEVED domain-containing protein n=1 Tax=Psychroserpens ponticola TaxID=2932268 RepID=A0ABY7RUF7_9FLAO|nr:GEVED domain-containing protein [Psychroserpens ponticola]WCO00407.1 GEVED domain-containing protein [Psychroserpens ponticola]
MKKITLVLTLLTLTVQAQSFPSPYCVVDEADTSVEEITTVAFGGTTINNTDLLSLSVDETATIITVNQDETYTLEVQGNTYDSGGNAFDNDIVAFIDWNQNDILDDVGEIYQIGTITGSTGNDGTTVSMDIIIPTDAVLGTTRIRITKIYQDPDSPAEIDPCGILFYPFGFGPYGGYGQALDFTLEVEEALAFPLPYCVVDEVDVLVEEITTVTFGGTTINNSDLTSVSIDETATIITVNQDETYTLEVQGNTYDSGGNAFDNDIVAFIDWNQNDILDDTGEIYSIGTITGSTGSDGVSVTMDITIPTNAVLGTTRIRITKTYQDPDSPAEIDPCGILFYPFGFGPFGGYGQALDFTLEVEAPLSVAQFELDALAVYPIPAKDVLNVNYNSVLSAVKIYNLVGQEVFVEETASATLQLDLSSLAIGTYIVKLFSEEAVHTLKIIKQ